VILVGDCRARMAELEPESVDAIVTDPPYELGFMGKAWDASGIAYDIEVWNKAWRVLKPGGHLLAFSGSRTYHRMVCAIEDAGFEIRDQIMWLYGSGFPKSHDVSKAIDREAGAVREIVGLRQAHSPYSGNSNDSGLTTDKWRDERTGTHEVHITASATPEAARWQGWGTALKPAHEPIVVARKPLRGTVAQNVLAHGTGAINVDGCRVGTEGDTLGRWPANVIHDGSAEVVGAFPGDGEASAARFFYTAKASRTDRDEGLEGWDVATLGEMTGGRAEGSAGLDSPRAGAGRTTGRANVHPTVKPTSLMRYLCRLVTPPGGTVLDPFTGSGSTGKAAVLEGFRFIGIELSPQYAEIARARIAAAAPGLEDDEPEAEEVQRPEVPGQLRLFA
jgi:DNA modification methylase